MKFSEIQTGKSFTFQGQPFRKMGLAIRKSLGFDPRVRLEMFGFAINMFDIYPEKLYLFHGDEEVEA